MQPEAILQKSWYRQNRGLGTEVKGTEQLEPPREMWLGQAPGRIKSERQAEARTKVFGPGLGSLSDSRSCEMCIAVKFRVGGA